MKLNVHYHYYWSSFPINLIFSHCEGEEAFCGRQEDNYTRLKFERHVASIILLLGMMGANNLSALGEY